MNRINLPPYSDIKRSVVAAIEEDVGNGDITAQLISATQMATAKIITRVDAVLCGTAWADEVCAQIDPTIEINWKASDGEPITKLQVIAELKGSARSLLTAERTILNFLQTLSAASTKTQQLLKIVSHTGVKILDTRKTIPGLRLAQKYAVAAGGGTNHRIGLYDAYLIKENHIAACGGIKAAISTARKNEPSKQVEVEVQDIDQLKCAIESGVDVALLDNFSLEMTAQAVAINAGAAKLEASGNIDKNSLKLIAETGVDFISIGALTKNCEAVDLSMLFEESD